MTTTKKTRKVAEGLRIDAYAKALLRSSYFSRKLLVAKLASDAQRFLGVLRGAGCWDDSKFDINALCIGKIGSRSRHVATGVKKGMRAEAEERSIGHALNGLCAVRYMQKSIAEAGGDEIRLIAAGMLADSALAHLGFEPALAAAKVRRTQSADEAAMQVRSAKLYLEVVAKLKLERPSTRPSEVYAYEAAVLDDPSNTYCKAGTDGAFRQLKSKWRKLGIIQ